MRVRGTCLEVAIFIALSACGSDDKGSEASEDSASAEAFEAQAARGQSLYGEKCAGCHGAAGQGTAGAPRLVGLEQGALPLEPPEGAMLRESEFETAADVAQFVVATMPPGAPGSLSTEEYLAVLAFALKANGIELEQELDLTLAKTLTIPR